MAQVSIIVPVYKVERCLDRCVQSILAQSFSDFELILVEDGSPDNCGRMCDDYARQDARIHVIHQKNAGAAAARNAGLDWVEKKGESLWLCFVDSDDWIHPNMLEYLYHAALEKNTDISVCGYTETSGDLSWEEASLCPAESWRPADFYRERYINATVPWGKLYRRECFAGMRYSQGKYLDDEFLTYRLLFGVEFLAVVPYNLYAYYCNPQGLTKCAWNPKLLYAWEAYEEQIVFFTQRSDEQMVRFRYRDYIDSGKEHLAAAQADLAQWGHLIPKMKKQLRSMVRRAWKLGHIEFLFDYDFLKQIVPVRARIHRLWLRIKK